MGMIAVMSAYAITAETCAKYAVNGSLSYCLEIGRRVAAIQAGEPGAFAEFLSYCQASVLFTGKVIEMWRDEVHCWLVARDSATPWDVVKNRAYDGQPPLWYLLLWCLQRISANPLSMQVVHVAIAVAVVWLFVAYAPFGRPARALSNRLTRELGALHGVTPAWH